MNWLFRSDRKAFAWLFVISFIIAVVVIFHNYWKIQLMYNSSLLSLYTPDTFNISPQHQTEHEQYVLKGTKEMKRSTIVICTLLRDAAKKIPEIKKRTERLGEEFLDYRIIIVENDSSDGTRRLLNEWREKNPRVVILGCGVNSNDETCHISKASVKTEGNSVFRYRIEKMVHLRNIYLEYVKSNLASFDFCVAWDLDIIGSVYLDGIANTIGHFTTSTSPAYNADAICAYGIFRWGYLTLYYDTYAHIDYDDVYHVDLQTLHHFKKTFGHKYDRGIPPVPVSSCFSGFTIYRIPSLLSDSVVYDMSPPDNLECEHVRLHKKLQKIYLNPSMVHLVLLNK